MVKEIPDIPSFTLRNYLLELVGEADKKESSVYLMGVHAFIKQLWDEILNRKGRDVNWREIPRKLGIHPQSIYGYKNGKKGISVQMLYRFLKLWREYCKKSEKEFNQKWEEIFRSDFTVGSHKGRDWILPKSITPKLSYLAGWICGDGHFGPYRNHYLIKISEKSIPQLKEVLVPLVHELFHADPKIHRMYQGGYALNLNSKPVFRFLTKVLKLRVGRFPEFVETLDDVNKQYFLAGVFDSEGYVNVGRKAITISQASKKFLAEVSDLFHQLGVVFNKPTYHETHLGTWYSIGLGSKKEVLNFSQLIGSYHIDKKEALRKILPILL